MGLKSVKNFGRNYWAMTFEGAAFMGGMAMLATNTVVAVFIDTMTGSKTLVGLAITAQALFFLVGQLLVAPYVSSIRNIPIFMFRLMLLRVIPVFMAVPLFSGVGAGPAVVIFLVLYSLFWLSDGLNTVPWGELAARALKPELRGHMMGMQAVIGGALSLLTGLLLTRLLETPLLTDHYRFGTIFIIGSVILMTSVFFIRMVRDPSPVLKPEKPDLRRYYAEIPAIIRSSKPLRQGLVARIPGYVGFSTITFMVVFGSSALDLTAAQVSWLVYSQIVGSLIGGSVLGEASRWFGNKAVILMSNTGVIITLCMAVVLIVFPGLGYTWLIVLCVFAGIWTNNWVGYFNYFLDIAPKEKRPMFQIIGNCIGIPFSFIGYALGYMIDRLGYNAVFIFGGVSAGVTILLSLRLLSRKKINALREDMQ